MLAFSTPISVEKFIKDAINNIPENEELGEKMVEICLVILSKAVKLTKTDMGRSIIGSCQEGNGIKRGRRVIHYFL